MHLTENPESSTSCQQMGCYNLFKIKYTILTLIRFSQEKHERGMFELVDAGNQQSNK